MMRAHGGGFLGPSVLMVLALAAPAEGQIAWDAPMLLAPAAPAGFGIHLLEPWPGDGIGVLGTYRASPAPIGMGLRGGLGEGGDRLALSFGLDVSGWVSRAQDDVPIDVMWFTGAGLGVGHAVLMSFPLGISVGADLPAEEVTFRPYLAPRVVLDACIGDGGGRRHGCRSSGDLDLDVAVDIGLDLELQRGYVVRFAATLGDREALLIGLTFP